MAISALLNRRDLYDVTESGHRAIISEPRIEARVRDNLCCRPEMNDNQKKYRAAVISIWALTICIPDTLFQNFSSSLTTLGDPSASRQLRKVIRTLTF